MWNEYILHWEPLSEPFALACMRSPRPWSCGVEMPHLHNGDAHLQNSNAVAPHITQQTRGESEHCLDPTREKSAMKSMSRISQSPSGTTLQSLPTRTSKDLAHQTLHSHCERTKWMAYPPIVSKSQWLPCNCFMFGDTKDQGTLKELGFLASRLYFHLP